MSGVPSGLAPLPRSLTARASGLSDASPPSAAAVAGGSHRPVPAVTVSRLPVYLRALTALAEEGVLTVSSETLAAQAGVSAAKLRKDLSQLGSFGTRGVGYDVPLLLACISSALGLTQHWPVVVVGVGNLGQALAGHGGFASRGFQVAALLDVDPERVGTRIAGVAVRPLEDLEDVVAGLGGQPIGVIATPAAAAQEVADRLVAAGVTSVLNFAPIVLAVPEEVEVRKVDLALELQVLSFHQARRSASPSALTGVTA